MCESCTHAEPYASRSFMITFSNQVGLLSTSDQKRTKYCTRPWSISGSTCRPSVFTHLHTHSSVSFHIGGALAMRSAAVAFVTHVGGLGSLPPVSSVGNAHQAQCVIFFPCVFISSSARGSSSFMRLISLRWSGPRSFKLDSVASLCTARGPAFVLAVDAVPVLTFGFVTNAIAAPNPTSATNAPSAERKARPFLRVRDRW